ncbi:MAG: hypothetical protein ABIN72_00970 [Sphingomicrobium sp.]
MKSQLEVWGAPTRTNLGTSGARPSSFHPADLYQATPAQRTKRDMIDVLLKRG